MMNKRAEQQALLAAMREQLASIAAQPQMLWLSPAGAETSAPAEAGLVPAEMQLKASDTGLVPAKMQLEAAETGLVPAKMQLKAHRDRPGGCKDASEGRRDRPRACKDAAEGCRGGPERWQRESDSPRGSSSAQQQQESISPRGSSSDSTSGTASVREGAPQHSNIGERATVRVGAPQRDSQEAEGKAAEAREQQSKWELLSMAAKRPW
jgi:hypothetical protein